MSQKATNGKPAQLTTLTNQQETAACAVAQDDKTDQTIATEIGITKRTLERWKKLPHFAARVTQHRRAWQDAVLREGLATRAERIRGLQLRHRQLRQIVDERAADPNLHQVPGGQTGLITRKSHVVGTGDNARVVWDHYIDTGLLREMRMLERQIAQELGQWVEKQSIDVAKLDQQIEEFLEARDADVARRVLAEHGLAQSDSKD